MAAQKEEKFEFQAEVSRLLDIVTNALYSNNEVFLRELISNASDACDRLRYEAISTPDLTKENPDYKIHIETNEHDKKIIITDNGIGMNKEDLIENLGTIARSGTAKIMEQLKASKEAKGDLSLIGQFGVGFYASFMIAENVEVITQKAGEKNIWHWQSDGQSNYTLRPASTEEQTKIKDGRGTVIILHTKKEGNDFLLPERVKMIIEKYSDHIDVPVYLNDEEEALNQALALWTRSKTDITEEQYTQFYKSLTYGFDDPLMTCHWKAEGKIEYTALLYLPTMRPFDLYDPKRQHAVKLYVKKVFITDDCEGLIYPWMRFLRGIVDSQDLPLNISREMLQHNPLVAKIRNGVTKRVLSDLEKLAKNDEEKFLAFWGQFGPVLKEGLYDALEHREAIFKVCRFRSTNNPDQWISLADYKDQMKDGQETIYYISGSSVESIKDAPQLEGFKSRDINVLFMADTIDEFWLQNNPEFNGLKFKSVTRGSDDLSKFSDEKTNDIKESKDTEAENANIKTLVEKLQKLFANDLHNVRISKRLTDSPVCFVVPDGQTDMHMENVLKIQQKYDPQTKRILEINPSHPVITKLADKGDDVDEDSLWMLYDQACILQGEPPKNPSAFAKRLNKFMSAA